jgi:hypothetical protein
VGGSLRALNRMPAPTLRKAKRATAFGFTQIRECHNPTTTLKIPFPKDPNEKISNHSSHVFAGCRRGDGAKPISQPKSFSARRG